MNVTIKIVSKISAKSAKNRSLLNMLTKLHVWGMIEFDQVLFFDSDFLFLRNPASAFQECGGHAFCACADTGIGSYSRGGIKASNYFNSGFMVIRPSEQVFAHLTTRENIAKAEGTQFVDQDMLNNVFQGRWKRLDSKYNLMHVHGPIANRTIAVHEKLWIMQEKYPTGHWIWNKHRSQVESLRTESGFAEGMHALKRRRFHSSLKSATEKADPQSLLNQKDNRNSDGEEQENAKRSIYYSNRRTGA